VNKAHDTWDIFCIIHSFRCKHVMESKKLWITYVKSETDSTEKGGQI
jgi:hypothetical protein